MRIVITEQDGLTKVKTITSFSELRREFSGTSFTRPFTQEQLDIASGGTAFISTEVERPRLLFGQSATLDDERQADGTWLQVWTVSSITLGAAKIQLNEMAALIYWHKMNAEPTPQELQAEAGYAGTIAAREARFNPKLADVRTRIQAASTAQAARAILAELEALD